MRWLHRIICRQRQRLGKGSVVLPDIDSVASVADASLQAALHDWLALDDPRQARLFLLAHRDLLTAAIDPLLASLLMHTSQQTQQYQELCLRRAIVLAARQGDDPTQSIQDAYINLYGGYALDLPAWLMDLITQDDTFHQPRSEQDLQAWIAQWENALARAQREALAAVIHAEIVIRLSLARKELSGHGHAQDVEASLAALQDTTSVFSQERYPYQWARVQTVLGEVWPHRVLGERADNIEQAITACEAALHIVTRETFPVAWARAHHALGNAYWERIRGDRAENLERAIAANEAALQVRTAEAFPYDWAQTQTNLGNAYRRRLRGDRAENLERAIAAYEATLQVYTQATFPIEWARTQNNLGVAYTDRLLGDRAENQEQAIAAYEATLQIRTRETFPVAWARTQNNLGVAYFYRLRGDRAENLERALAAYEAALRIRTLDAFPLDWALTQLNIGELSIVRIRGDRAENVERAIAVLEAAIPFRPRDVFPYSWAGAQEMLGVAYAVRTQGEPTENHDHAIRAFTSALEVYAREAYPHECRRVLRRLGERHATAGHWEAAAARWAEATAVEADLFVLAAGAAGRDAMVRAEYQVSAYQAFALTQLGRLAEAAVAIEVGRARGLAEARRFDQADPGRIGDPDRRRRYTTALAALREAQARLQQPGMLDERDAYLEAVAHYRTIRAQLDVLVDEIHAAHDPGDFLQQAIMPADLLSAARSLAPGHGIVYLIATPWGGVALGALAGNPRIGTIDRFAAYELPDLTTPMLDDLLIQQRGEHSQQVLGGYGLTQERDLLDRLAAWPGDTLADQIAAIEAAAQAAGQQSSLAQAVRAALAVPALQPFASMPLHALANADREHLAAHIDYHVLREELRRCLDTLSRVVMHPLTAWLRTEGITGVTLIPCGALALFPLLAAPIEETPASWQTLGDGMPASCAPSVSALLHTDQVHFQRRGVCAIGNPLPSPHPLEWGEAEALTLAYLGGDQRRERVHIGYEATRQWFIDAAKQASIFAVACHGQARGEDFLHYQILLANGEAVTLADALNRVVDLQGMRLLILSACQTSLLHWESAHSEMRSLAVGMLQAGSQAVLAAQWPVDDRATYLLMVRFAQEWFPVRDEEPPATALARAQRWLRTITWRELRGWVARELLPAVTADATLTAHTTQVAEESLVVTRRTMRPAAYIAEEQRETHGQRLGIKRAEGIIQERARTASPDECPFADPYYWAAWQITGW